jgi:hypothetical protein
VDKLTLLFVNMDSRPDTSYYSRQASWKQAFFSCFSLATKALAFTDPLNPGERAPVFVVSIFLG